MLVIYRLSLRDSSKHKSLAKYLRDLAQTTELCSKSNCLC